MDQPRLDGKVVVITGASRGMGREMAIACAGAGASGVTISAAAAPDETREEIESELAGVVEEIEAAGGRAISVHADVCNPSDCDEVVRQTVETFGGLDVLFNHAGKSQRYHGARGIPFWETNPEGWRMVIVTNVVGPYIMARAAVPQMLKGGWGRIINTSKSADSMHEAFAGAYGPSKAGLEAEALSWAEELAGTGVTVNCLQPGGAVATRFGRGQRDNTRGLPANVMVPCALWLASPMSDGVNGCRFDAKKWNPELPPDEAAQGCREPALFPRPAKETKLDQTWQDPIRT